MNQNYEQTEFAPWKDHSENITAFEIQHQYPESTHQQHIIPEKHVEQFTTSSRNIVIRRVDKYAKVLPKVYEKNHQQVNSNKKVDPGLQVVLKAINKNELIIHIPQNPLHLPRVQIEHPIKHSIKILKRNPQAPDSNPDKNDLKNYPNIKKDKDTNRLTDIKERIRKNSEDLTYSHTYANVLKRKNKYEQQIVKRCSLKNLKIYGQESSEYKVQQILQKKQVKMGNRDFEKKEKKHILDRILSRLQ